MVVLEETAVSYERSTPVGFSIWCLGLKTSSPRLAMRLESKSAPSATPPQVTVWLRGVPTPRSRERKHIVNRLMYGQLMYSTDRKATDVAFSIWC